MAMTMIDVIWIRRHGSASMDRGLDPQPLIGVLLAPAFESSTISPVYEIVSWLGRDDHGAALAGHAPRRVWSHEGVEHGSFLCLQKAS